MPTASTSMSDKLAEDYYNGEEFLLTRVDKIAIALLCVKALA